MNLKEDKIKTILICVGMVVIGVGIGYLLNRPTVIPKLESGEEVLAKIDGKDFTANDLYKELKSQGGSTVMLSLIDDYIANIEITDNKEAIDYAESYLSNLKAQYEMYNYNFEEALVNAGYATEKDFINAVAKDHMLTLAAEKYIKDHKISDKEINDYYKSDIYGSMHVRYILVKPEHNDEMTEEEVKKAEEDALKEAKEVIKKLDNGEKFEDLAKKHSDDASTASQGGLFDGFTKNDVVEEFWNASIKLEDDKYTKEPVKSSYGYFVIYRIKQDEKPSVEDVKDEILDAILKKKESEDEKIINKTWIDIRKSYNLDIIDTEIKDKYAETIKDLK